jgi:hypothetical protein
VTTTAPAPTLLEFGHAVLGVLHDFAHLPAPTGLHLLRPGGPVVTLGEPYTFASAYSLAVWAQEFGQPIRFNRAPLPEFRFAATLGGIRFEFTASLYAGMVDEYERRAGVTLARPCEITPADMLAALGDHPAVVAGHR